MRAARTVAVLLLAASPTLAQAETLRCTITHIVTTSDYKGLHEDLRDTIKDTEFFLAMDANGRGSLNFCGKEGTCTDKSPIEVLVREGDNDPNQVKVRIRLLVNRFELWLLERWQRLPEWELTAVSAGGFTSMTRYGKCGTIIPQ